MRAGLRRLGLFGVVVGAAWWLALGDTRLFFFRFPQAPNPADFSLYFLAARVGIEHGWSHLYDIGLQRAEYFKIHAAPDPYGWFTYYITPPPLAWLVAPLTLLGYPLAYYLWTAVNCAAYGVTGWFAAPGDRLARAALVLAGATTFPFLIALQNGQVTILLTAGVVAAWLALRRGREGLAALALLPLLVKPQVAYLVPVVLLLHGRRRTIVTWAGLCALLGLAALASLGASGIADWRSALGAETGHPENQIWTLGYLFGSSPIGLLAEAAAALLVLGIAWIRRRGSLELSLASALIGSLLAAPYHQSSDAVVLLAALWLYLRASPPAWHWAWLGFGFVAAFLGAPLGPRPILVFAAGWLLLCAHLAWRDLRPAAVRADPAVAA